jgi:hypothetical protein
MIAFFKHPRQKFLQWNLRHTIIIIIIIIMDPEQFIGPWPLFQFEYVYTIGRTHWTGDQPRRKSSTYTQDNINTE